MADEIELADERACTDPCPLTLMFGIMGGKWKSKIICTLNLNETLHYGEIKRRVKGVTPTMLAGSLRELEGARHNLAHPIRRDARARGVRAHRGGTLARAHHGRHARLERGLRQETRRAAAAGIARLQQHLDGAKRQRHGEQGVRGPVMSAICALQEHPEGNPGERGRAPDCRDEHFGCHEGRKLS